MENRLTLTYTTADIMLIHSFILLGIDSSNKIDYFAYWQHFEYFVESSFGSCDLFQCSQFLWLCKRLPILQWNIYVRVQDFFRWMLLSLVQQSFYTRPENFKYHTESCTLSIGPEMYSSLKLFCYNKNLNLRNQLGAKILFYYYFANKLQLKTVVVSTAFTFST